MEGMAINHYTLTIFTPEFTAKFKVTYKDNKFNRLEHISGKMPDSYWNPFMNAIPQANSGIDRVCEKYPTVTYQPFESKPKTLFQDMMGEYMDWFQRTNGFTPAMDGIGGKNLNGIIAKMRKISPDEEEIFNTWQVIFLNWSKLEKFYQEQQELRQINTNLNIILRTIKNGGTGKNKANDHANDLRKKV